MDTEYYDILGVEKNASEDEIKKSYKKMAMKWHPDKNLNNKEKAEEHFKKISEAYNILSDSEKRDIYDRLGKKGLERGDMEMDPSNIHEMFQSMFRREQPSFSVPPIKVNVTITLNDVYNGKKVKKNITRETNCKKCNGNGTSDGKSYICKECRGKGFVIIIRQMGPMIQQMQTECRSCSGSGKSVNKLVGKCKKCNGRCNISESLTIEFDIPKGAMDEQVIQLNNLGHELPENEKRGDTIRSPVVVILNEEKSPVYHRGYKRDPSNLFIVLDITLAEALCGFRKLIPYFNDKELVIEEDEVVNDETIRVVREKGLPSLNNPSILGDLFIQYNIIFPDNINKNIKQKLWQLLTNTAYNKDKVSKLTGEQYMFVNLLSAENDDNNNNNNEDNHNHQEECKVS